MAAMAGAKTDVDRLRAVERLHADLAAAIEPWVRWDAAQSRLAVSLAAARPSPAVGAAFSWSVEGTAARVDAVSDGGTAASLTLRPGRIAIDDGAITLRTRCKAAGEGAAELAAEALDALFAHVKRAREPAPQTRVDAGVLAWERPANRCELLLALARALGRPLAGEIRFDFADGRMVLHLDGHEDGRWETTGGAAGPFDPWPFAIWLERRHAKLQRPALRVAIEPEPTRPRTCRTPRAAKPRTRGGTSSRAAPRSRA
jgi:hypothetical protein